MNLDPVRSIAALSSRWRSRFSCSQKLPEHLRRGARGEKLARRFLRSHGYKILYRNFRACGGGEIDIVCRDGDTLVFVEVKTRSDIKVIELLSESPKSWEDAAQSAIREASRTLRNIRSLYVKEMTAAVENGRITSYRLNSKVTLELEGTPGVKK